MNDLNTTAAPDAGVASDPHYTLWQLVRYMLALGSWGFGGPVALAGYMYRDLVERRQWITDADYKEGLALAQLMPGPLAAQLAMYLGYVHYRFIGATLVGVAFVLPSFLMVVALGAAYTAYGGLGWMQSVFYGVGAAVIGIIAISAYKLTSKSIGRDRLLWPIFLISAAITVACALVALSGAAVHVGFEQSVRPDLLQWGVLLLMGAGPVGAAFLLWDHGTKHGDIALLGSLSYLAPLLSTLLLVLAGRAAPHWSQAVAIGLLLLGAWLSVKSPRAG